MPAGCGDAEYVGVMQRMSRLPRGRSVRTDPGLVRLRRAPRRPARLDGAVGAGYLALASIVRGLAEELCGGRLMFALEGGYALTGLAEGTSAILTACLADRAAPVPDSGRSRRAACSGTW